jgi:hypothetical protein
LTHPISFPRSQARRWVVLVELSVMEQRYRLCYDVAFAVLRQIDDVFVAEDFEPVEGYRIRSRSAA